MDASILRSYHADLSRHPLFRGLKAGEFLTLKDYYQILRIPGGVNFLSSGDGADSLYVILSGALRKEGKCLYKGDYWGLENLIRPDPGSETCDSTEELILMRLKSENFRRMLRDYPGLSRHFRPRQDGEKHLIMGMPREDWRNVRQFTSHQEKRGTLIHYRSHSSRKSFFLMLLFPLVLVFSGWFLSVYNNLFLLLVPPGVLIGGCELFLRKLTLYKVSDKAVIKRFFNWRTLRQDQEIIPLDQIQSVVISTKGLAAKLLRIGDLQVQTAGKGILFQQIDSPAKLQTRLMDLKRRSLNEEKSRDRDSLREIISSRFLSPEKRDEILYSGDLAIPEEENLPEKRVFRKSLFLLLLQLLPPLAVMASGGYSALLIPVEQPVLWILAVTVLGGGGLLRSLWLAADWWNDIYMIQLPYIWDIERKPLGKKDIRKQTELSLVLNVTASQKGLASLLFNYGDVTIETAGPGEPLVFYTVRAPFNVQNELLDYRDYSLRKGELRKRAQAREDLMEFTEVLDQTRQRETDYLKKNRPLKPGSQI